jgi:uncharacterized membrane protein
MITLSNTLFGTIFVILVDSVYLKLNKKMYEPILDPSVGINYTSALISWLIIVITIQLVILSRKDLTESNAILYGAFLGFGMYGLYNATNYATFSNKWNIKMAIVDTAWGTFLTSLATYFIYKLNN